MIKSLAVRLESARSEYDALCEFVHPNYGSNKLVSSGQLGSGQIRSHAEGLGPELSKVHWLIERCAILVDDDFNKETTFYLTRIGSWIEIACQDGAKLGQVFSVRGAVSGDGRTKETAVLFKKKPELTEKRWKLLRVPQNGKTNNAKPADRGRRRWLSV
jgi:hypothetical protein